jgi:hypothetical protein
MDTKFEPVPIPVSEVYWLDATGSSEGERTWAR